MLQLYKNIKERRLALGLTQTDLALKTGYKDKSMIAKIEAGKVDLSQSKISAFAEALQTTPSVLLGNTVEQQQNLSALDDALFDIVDIIDQAEKGNIIPLPKMRSIPLLGTIACGQPILAQENLEGEVSTPSHVTADFTLRCKGDSMINARIFDGDIVYIRQQETVEDGQIAAVLIDEEATLKRVHFFSDRIVLEAANPLFQPIVLWGEDMSQVRIIGKAVAFTSTIL